MIICKSAGCNGAAISMSPKRPLGLYDRWIHKDRGTRGLRAARKAELEDKDR